MHLISCLSLLPPGVHAAVPKTSQTVRQDEAGCLAAWHVRPTTTLRNVSRDANRA